MFKKKLITIILKNIYFVDILTLFKYNVHCVDLKQWYCLQELILDTLHFCMRVDTQSALEANAMEAFTSLLKHELPVIRAKAARDIMDLRCCWSKCCLLLIALKFICNDILIITCYHGISIPLS